MSSREGFGIEQAEITASGGRFGGAWGPCDPGTYCPHLIQWLVALFPIKNVVDLGCGYGASLRQFRSLGCQVLGIEAMGYYATRCDVPVIQHDLEQSPLKLGNIDLVYSIEAVEHISQVNNTLDTLCNGKMVCMSAALPGQIGHHHVSCYPQEWWIESMRRRGYAWEEELSEKARALAGGYFGMSGMLFVRKELRLPWGLAQGEFKSEGSQP